MPVDFPATRWSLIARLPDQPQQAAALVGLYADAVGEYLRRRLAGERRERVDDVIQDVLLDLMRKPELLSRAAPGSGSRFRYYLMNLAWLAALNAIRHERRRDHASIDAAGEDDSPMVDRLASDVPAPDQRQAMDRAWALSVLQQALDDLQRWAGDGTLEPEAYAVLKANLIDGKTLRDVAKELGIPLTSCHRRLAKARMLLQQAIVERLRLAGELGAEEDPARAAQVLMELVANG
ncbi:MAG: sigma-70 family RNA polymerase sigma factor [Planctomycetes bacterium]|jgi:RNA polymerase sigma factor (sigma-70 family)|nr:sigma-70 family RNA polymerase sigma factor [Planctomycetota bacterium]